MRAATPGGPDRSPTATDPARTAHDPFTEMTPRFGRLAEAFARRFFASIHLEPGAADSLRVIEEQGAVVYVMRYSSRLDYFLFNWLFLARGIRLSSVANGIRFYYYRPLGEALRLLLRGLFDRLRLGPRGMRERQIVRMRRTLREGGSCFLFLRSAKIGQGLRTRRGRIASGHSELDYLREVVDVCFAEPVAVSLVPLALFWRRGSRHERRYLNVFYGAPARPSDTGKILSFLWNYRSLAVRVGSPINLRAFVDERRDGGRERVVKQVRRSLMIFLRREEKPVIGPALRLREKVEELVMGDREVLRVIEEQVAEGHSRARIEARARRHLRKIAARQSGPALAILAAIVGWMFERLFGRVEVHGLARTIEAAKLHPLVLVPSHRSHFDYLILSWLFYEHHVVPPHVAAGENLSFWPLGAILRRAGGFFLRRSFEGDRLYAAVFRGYVGMLIKDGSTQEFFIEGTRSRTGKTLIPRLGMLGMIVEAFSRGARRDLYLVPVGFTYERVVEEGSITEERRGAKKKSENLRQLLRAGRVFRHRFGSVVVRFGEPLSLVAQIGSVLSARELDDPAGVAARRRETEHLGHELARRINGVITAGRSAVSCAALLASRGEGLREGDFRERVEETVALLRLLGMPLTEPLERALSAGRPEASLDLLLQGNLVERRVSRTGDLIHFKSDVRDRLDLYRATLTPCLVWGAALALALQLREGRDETLREASAWLDLLRLEYFPPEDEDARRLLLGQVLEHVRSRGWIREDPSGRFSIPAEGVRWLDFFAAQVTPVLEAYGACFHLVGAMEGSGTRKQLVDAAQTALREAILLGESSYPEGVSPVTFGNALVLLVQEKVLHCEGALHQPTAQFSPGPRWDHLKELRRRLAGVLQSR